MKSAQSRGMNPKYESTKIKYVKESTYTPDVVLPNGIIVEIKGRFTASDRGKHLLIQSQHPKLDIRFVFQYDDWLTRKKKTRYSQWCERNGFKYAVGSIPIEWSREKQASSG